MPETKIGKVSHYFGKLGVAAIELTDGGIKVGDRIHFKGHTTNFEDVVNSIQIEHTDVDEAKIGDSIGIKVSQPVREHDEVFLVTD